MRRTRLPTLVVAVSPAAPSGGGFLTRLPRHGYLGLSVACRRSHAG